LEPIFAASLTSCLTILVRRSFCRLPRQRR
jgi:hypothetical protein